MIDEKKLIEKIQDRIKGNISTAESLKDIIPLIEEQPKMGEWIPCSEKLPDVKQACLVTVKYSGFYGKFGNFVEKAVYLGNGEWNSSGDIDYIIDGEVTAWMPRPWAYKQMKELCKELEKDGCIIDGGSDSIDETVAFMEFPEVYKENNHD